MFYIYSLTYILCKFCILSLEITFLLWSSQESWIFAPVLFATYPRELQIPQERKRVRTFHQLCTAAMSSFIVPPFRSSHSKLVGQGRRYYCSLQPSGKACSRGLELDSASCRSGHALTWWIHFARIACARAPVGAAINVSNFCCFLAKLSCG